MDPLWALSWPWPGPWASDLRATSAIDGESGTTVPVRAQLWVWRRRGGLGRGDEQRQGDKQIDHSRLICKFIATTIRVPTEFLVDLGNVILKLIWQRKCPGTAKNIVKNNSERGRAPSVTIMWPFSLKQQRDRLRGQRTRVLLSMETACEMHLKWFWENSPSIWLKNRVQSVFQNTRPNKFQAGESQSKKQTTKIDSYKSIRKDK